MMVSARYFACVAVFFSIVPVLVQAQVGSPGSAYDKASISDIELARRDQAQWFDEQASRCETTFAVTQCLARVRTERLAVEAALNRRERQLNDIQRSKQAKEQLERIQLKQLEHQAKLKSQARAAEDRRGANEATIKAKPTAAPPVSKTPRSAELSVAQRKANRQEFQRRQEEADARRKEVAARVKANTKPAPTLPAPP